MPVVIVAVGIGAILTAWVAYAASRQSMYWANAFVGWLADVLRLVPFVGGLGAAGVERLARWISHELGGLYLALERSVVSWVTGWAKFAAVATELAFGWPIKLYQVIEWLTAHEIPRLIHALAHGTTKIVSTTVTRVVRVERTVTKLPQLSQAKARQLVAAAVAGLVAPYLVPLRWLRSHFAALTHAVAHAPTLPLPREWADVKARLRNLEKIAKYASVAALVYAGLKALRLTWLRCSNVGKVARRLCGMDTNLINELLLDGVAIFSLLSVVEFANELRAVEDEAVKIMGSLVREWPA